MINHIDASQVTVTRSFVHLNQDLYYNGLSTEFFGRNFSQRSYFVQIRPISTWEKTCTLNCFFCLICTLQIRNFFFSQKVMWLSILPSLEYFSTEARNTSLVWVQLQKQNLYKLHKIVPEINQIYSKQLTKVFLQKRKLLRVKILLKIWLFGLNIY